MRRPAAPLLALLALAAPAPALAEEEQAPLCDPARDPLDAVAAAPEMHEVVREDDAVRVLRERLEPGETSGVHIHALPSVIEGEAGGAGAQFVYIAYAEVDGALVETSREVVTPAPGRRAVATGPEGPHAIANVGSVPLALLRTEMKPEACRAVG